eukprot:6210724-Pleurochrysis_carterae.AAC.5
MRDGKQEKREVMHLSIHNSDYKVSARRRMRPCPPRCSPRRRARATGSLRCCANATAMRALALSDESTGTVQTRTHAHALTRAPA